jgi:methyltransferase (TIGR00027 family)
MRESDLPGRSLQALSGVARTALYMSLIRQHESRRPDALFRDPLSEALVAELASSPGFDELASGLGATRESLDDVLDRPEFRYFAVRTRYFDDRLIEAMEHGVRQVVSLAAGMDGRAMRLTCPPGTHWYEIDKPEMVAAKEALIAHAGVIPTCSRSGIGADLASDWYGELQAAGFDSLRPSVWLIEGLLMYVPEEVADSMLARMTAASAAGSRLLLEHLDTRMTRAAAGAVQEAVKAQNSAFVSARDDVGEWLAGHGWRAVVHAGSDPAIGFGRCVPAMPAGWLACAVRSSRG